MRRECHAGVFDVRKRRSVSSCAGCATPDSLKASGIDNARACTGHVEIRFVKADV